MGKLKALLIAVSMPLMAFTGLAATTQTASAVIYCTYVGYPEGCYARPGVVLVARPYGVGRVGYGGAYYHGGAHYHGGARYGAAGVGHVGNHHAGNRNGGVNRAGRRR